MAWFGWKLVLKVTKQYRWGSVDRLAQILPIWEKNKFLHLGNIPIFVFKQYFCMRKISKNAQPYFFSSLELDTKNYYKITLHKTFSDVWNIGKAFLVLSQKCFLRYKKYQRIIKIKILQNNPQKVKEQKQRFMTK